MTARQITLNILIVLVLFRFGYAQEQLVVDYFRADIDSPTPYYLSDANKMHLDKVPGSVRSGDFHQALEDIKYVLAAFPNHPQALQLLVVVSKLSKKPSLPILYFENAIKLYPQYAITQAQFGGYLIDAGNKQAGIEKLKRAIEMDPNLVPAYVWLAKAYYLDNNLSLANEAAAKARELGYKGEIPQVKTEKSGK